MKARLRKQLDRLGDAFWILPAAMVIGCIVFAGLLLGVDRSGIVPAEARESFWLYNGTATGARTLLGAIVSSTIGVAGTVFSITIAALTLAAGQMGPRLLRSFTGDRGNQFTLGAFLGTFSYSLVVLRSVRTAEEGGFTPHVALTIGLMLAFGCVAVLIYFVGHMASRINVDTVIDLVGADMRSAIRSLIVERDPPKSPPDALWREAATIVDGRQGYLQQLDETGLARWAGDKGIAIRLLIRRGDFVFPGAPLALMTRRVPGAEAAVRSATALGSMRGGPGDAEHAARQLVEVAVRALSPGINDPHTAMSVLDQLGAILCELAGRPIANGVTEHEGRVALVVPSVDYQSLAAVMFHMIRQYAAGATPVLIKLLDVLTAVIACDVATDRRAVLLRHAALVMDDARRTIQNVSDLAEIERRFNLLHRVAERGAQGLFTGQSD